MSSILIKNAMIVTQNSNREIKLGDIYIDDGLISEIAPSIHSEAEYVLDTKGQVVIPGLINTHNHISMTLMRSLADDVHLNEFLEKTFAVDSRRTRKDVFAGSMLGVLELIKSGTTSFVDMYYWEDETAKAVTEGGIRGFLGWAVLDEDKSTQKGAPIKNAENFIREFRKKERIYPLPAVQGVYAASEETFLGAREVAEKYNTIAHLHLSETRMEVYEHEKKTGKRPAEWLDKIGFFYDHVLAAHSTWLTINEVRILARNGVSVAHCPTSNMKLATGGYAPLPEMFREGVNVSLATDGCASNNNMDMLEEMKICSLMHKAHRWDATVLDAQTTLDLATINGARALHMEDKIGSIEEEKRADIAVLNGRSERMLPLSKATAVSNIVYSAHGGDVLSTIVNGKLLMKNRQVLTMNEKAVLDMADERSRELLK